MSAGEVVGLLFAVIFAVLVAFLALVLVRLSQVLVESRKLVAGVTERTVPLLGEVTTSVTQVNVELQRVDAITTNVQSISGNVSALTGLFAATLGSPMVKVAAFSYGVRKAAARKERSEVQREVTRQVKAAKRSGR